MFKISLVAAVAIDGYNKQQTKRLPDYTGISMVYKKGK